MIEVLRTPTIPFRTEDESLKHRIFLKPENLQAFGSYKIRGVSSVVERAMPEDLENGFSVASAGNMAQAVAYAARKLGISCQVFVPQSAPEIKKQAIRTLGATLIEKPFEDIWNLVNGKAQASTKGLFIHPAFNENLLFGYGKIADELISDISDMDAVVVPFGVGGLALGIAQRIQQLKLDIDVYLAEPETAAPFRKSLQFGRATRIDRIPSFVDAIGTPEVLAEVFAKLSPLVKDSLVVSLEEIKKSLRELYFTHKLVSEGAAAAGLAAAIKLAGNTKHRKIACLITGGNIDKKTFDTVV